MFGRKTPETLEIPIGEQPPVSFIPASVLHHKAMEKVQKKDYKNALILEKAAANAIPLIPENEPIRSVLFFSAASLAKVTKNYPLSKKLIYDGLKGCKEPQLREEFLTLLKIVST